jgi:hypothetical protein
MGDSKNGMTYMQGSRFGLVRSKVSLWVRSTGSLVYPLLLGPSRDTPELLGSIPIVP